MEATTVKKMCGKVGKLTFLSWKKHSFLEETPVILHNTTFFIHQALKSMGLHLILFQIKNYWSYYMNLEQHYKVG